MSTRSKSSQRRQASNKSITGAQAVPVAGLMKIARRFDKEISTFRKSLQKFESSMKSKTPGRKVGGSARKRSTKKTVSSQGVAV
jgi:hypothetical protein